MRKRRSKFGGTKSRSFWKLMIALMACLVLAKLLLHERPIPEYFPTIPTSASVPAYLAVN